MKIPWAELGIGGAIAIVVICVVLAFVLKLWQTRDQKNKQQKCLDSDQVKKALMNNELTTLSTSRIETHLEKIKEYELGQMGMMKEMIGLQREQNASLREIARNGKRSKPGG